MFKIQDGGGRHLENRFFGHNVSLGYNCCMSNFLTKLLFYMVGFSFSFRIEW